MRQPVFQVLMSGTNYSRGRGRTAAVDRFRRSRTKDVYFAFHHGARPPGAVSSSWPSPALSVILNHRSLQRIHHLPAKVLRQIAQHRFIHQVPLRLHPATRCRRPEILARFGSRYQSMIARRQKNNPPGFNTRQLPSSIAWKCSSSRAKCRTALLITRSAKASGKDEASPRALWPE